MCNIRNYLTNMTQFSHIASSLKSIFQLQAENFTNPVSDHMTMRFLMSVLKMKTAFNGRQSKKIQKMNISETIDQIFYNRSSWDQTKIINA